MTLVNIDELNGTTVLSISGHAGYDSSGNDIVCSAVSCISQSFCETVKLYSEEDQAKILSHTYNEELGTLLFSYQSNSKEIKGALSMLKVGLKMLENTYSNYLKINF